MSRHFRSRGIEAEVCDIRHTIYKDGRLYSPTGHVVDVVYRRAVTSDVMSYYDEIQDFMPGSEGRLCVPDWRF